MYLSRIPLNPARKGTRLFVTSAQVTHAAVMTSFPPSDHVAAADSTDNGRVLWRIDRAENTIHLYVVSPTRPDFTHIVEQAGWPTTTTWATRDYRDLLDNLATGQRWHFRLTANPVRRAMDRVRNDPTERGRTTGLDSSGQLHWLQRKAAEHGFELGQCVSGDSKEPDVIITDRRSVTFQRHSHTVSLSTATFEGTLQVTDPQRLRAALIGGIGRAKGYGCGLLTLAPA
ncbi:type I-E CRISPR-associated protein Cas6/Cse3/CasE [Nocardia amikacinitolerans]|uniref:type I-E CRISPR-associated protein Cas6/Cse3/CasE n=1 Tax=Nocardia amikacinitolerans TaxID=756689 RepID=UPI0020A3DD2D|nr:type I-E CRISPR-associated protein Cas6/Cse3/CasE [Nocardia amikacinitolerans]MCP2292049.1 CRISPR system Cascade subunit CasE [Nocardia amikacinitolerans]